MVLRTVLGLTDAQKGKPYINIRPSNLKRQLAPNCPLYHQLCNFRQFSLKSVRSGQIQTKSQWSVQATDGTTDIPTDDNQLFMVGGATAAAATPRA